MVLPECDVIGLQESNSDLTPLYRRTIGWGGRLDPRPGPGAVDILHRTKRLTRVDGGVVRAYIGGKPVEQGAGPEPAAAKWITWGRYSDGGREFTVIALHLIASWTQPSHVKRRALAKEQLRDAVRLADDHSDAPVVIVGDFNAQPKHPAMRILRGAGFDVIKPPRDTFGRRKIDFQAVRGSGPHALTVTERHVIDLPDPFDHRAVVYDYEWSTK